MKMVDLHFPTADRRELVFSRYTQPEKDRQILLSQMKLKLPEKYPPRFTTKENTSRIIDKISRRSGDLLKASVDLQPLAVFTSFSCTSQVNPTANARWE